MRSQDNAIKKKAYNRPNLVIYGDITQLTQESATPEQNLDNHVGMTPNKTGFSM